VIAPPPDPALVVAAMTDLHHPIKAAVAEWAARELEPGDMVARDADSVFFREAWIRCAERGIQASMVPTLHGGRGNDAVTTALELEGLGKGCRDNGLGFALASQMVTFQEAIARFGSEDQQRALLPAACAGELIGSFAITEPDAGSDSYAMATTAVRDGDGYVLDGHKAHITLAPVADIALVFAKTAPAAGAWGISAFLVHLDSAGVQRSANRPKMGLRTTPYGDIVLDGYRAAEADRLGPEGAGVSIFTAIMEGERSMIFATQLGAAERTIERAVERANTRRQFGQTIGSFQAVSHRLADMAVAHDTARTAMYRALATIGRGERAMLVAAMAKLVSGESLAEIALDAARVHGAEGYLSEHEVEREVRDALGGFVYGGTGDIQRNLVARLMGVNP
jgi:alkylation response protein AidB-like acyl-CoA dehydrogenase